MMETLPVPKIPVSTYRLQFNHHFTFRDAAKLIGFFRRLGITDIYSSPYFKAQPGSLHGYDIVDHNCLNPEVGSEEDYAAMVEQLRRHEMGQMLDIVPNHMCIESHENVWWRDVLESGASSPYATYFDIDWEPVKKELRNKILLPILGDQYGNVLERQELEIVFDDGAFFARYYEHLLPLHPPTYALLLGHELEQIQAGVPSEDPEVIEFLSIMTALKHLPSYTETASDKIAEQHREKEVIKRRLATLFSASAFFRNHIREKVRLFNGTKGDAKSFDLLDGLLNQQVYRLSHWRVATEEINYRRFFDINGLGAIRMERPEVFDASHAFLFKLIKNGSVTGLRIDHPDGLYNPVEYFHRLQRRCFISLSNASGSDGSPDEEKELAYQYDQAVLADSSYKPFYIVGEKILTKSERMPEDWPIFSTTGYVFLNSVNGVFIDSENAKALDRIYEKFTGRNTSIQETITEKKKLVMDVAMASELNTLGHYLNDLSEMNRRTRDFTLNSLRTAVVEVAACFPVYRTYTNTWSVADRDRQIVELAISKAKRKNPAMNESIFNFVKDVLLLRFPVEMHEEHKAAWLDFVMRFQQITGPVMAKGVEDTAFYVYNRFVSLNEVGGMPERIGTPLDTFHGQNRERIKSWPHALIATMTHDSKRSEDVRARINVLSEMPREWSTHISTWARLNKKKKTIIDGHEAPDRNEEYLLYQTLIGAWPLEPLEPKTHETFLQRMRDYLIKATREAKINTSWINPNEAYEEALRDFIDEILRLTPGNRFLTDFLPFQRRVSHYGMFNSLSQTVLKICAPGVPDFYQGSELWDFRLVDPDNRKPIDYEKRIALLDSIQQQEAAKGTAMLAKELSSTKEDGRIKMYVVSKLLHFRRNNRALFESGEYIPLPAAGSRSDHVCAFARRSEKKCAIVCVPRFLSKLVFGENALPQGTAVWEDTHLILPDLPAGVHYYNIFTGQQLLPGKHNGDSVINLSRALEEFPVAVLERQLSNAA